VFTRRLAFCMVLFAAVATGCAAAPTAPAVSGSSPVSASVSPAATNAGSSATPTAVTTAASSSGPAGPSATNAAVRLSGNGPLAPGTYYLDDRAFTNATRLTITVPAGWTTEEYGELYKDRDEPGEVKFITWVLTHVFSDVCRWGASGALVDVGTTVDELATALSEQEGRDASAPSSVTVGGFPAKSIQLTVPVELDPATCTNEVLRYWPAPGPDMTDGDCCASPGSTDTVYVVDITGNRLVVVARHHPSSSAENRAVLQSIVDSIEIAP
jgi:hypothetical protein